MIDIKLYMLGCGQGGVLNSFYINTENRNTLSTSQTIGTKGKNIFYLSDTRNSAPRPLGDRNNPKPTDTTWANRDGEPMLISASYSDESGDLGITSNKQQYKAYVNVLDGWAESANTWVEVQLRFDYITTYDQVPTKDTIIQSLDQKIGNINTIGIWIYAEDSNGDIIIDSTVKDIKYVNGNLTVQAQTNNLWYTVRFDNSFYVGGGTLKPTGTQSEITTYPKVTIIQDKIQGFTIHFNKAYGTHATELKVNGSPQTNNSNEYDVVLSPSANNIVIEFIKLNKPNQPLEIASIISDNGTRLFDSTNIISYEIGKQSSVPSNLPSYGVVSGYGSLNLLTKDFKDYHDRGKLQANITADITRQTVDTKGNNKMSALANAPQLAIDVQATEFRQALNSSVVSMSLTDKLTSFSNNKWERIAYFNPDGTAKQFLDFIFDEFFKESYEFFDINTQTIFDSIILRFTMLDVSNALEALVAVMNVTTSNCYLNESGKIIIQSEQSKRTTDVITIQEQNCYDLKFDYFSSKPINKVEITEYFETSKKVTKTLNLPSKTNAVANGEAQLWGYWKFTSVYKGIINHNGTNKHTWDVTLDTFWHYYDITANNHEIDFESTTSHNKDDVEFAIKTPYGNHEAKQSSNNPYWSTSESFPLITLEDSIRYIDVINKSLGTVNMYNIQFVNSDVIRLNTKTISSWYHMPKRYEWLNYGYKLSNLPNTDPTVDYPDPWEWIGNNAPTIDDPAFSMQDSLWDLKYAQQGSQQVEIESTAKTYEFKPEVVSVGSGDQIYAFPDNKLVLKSSYHGTISNKLSIWIGNKILAKYKDGIDMLEFRHIARDYKFELGQQLQFIDKYDRPLFSSKQFEIVDTKFDGDWIVTAKELK
ncbi:MAG: hypothetical protein FWF56_03435 [Firmicutes bacterium]|nr:hypothetical protein [Bacillota bacterium]